MGRGRERTAAKDLRAEFGASGLRRALTGAVLRLLVFAALGVLGSQFLIR